MKENQNGKKLSMLVQSGSSWRLYGESHITSSAFGAWFSTKKSLPDHMRATCVRHACHMRATCGPQWLDHLEELGAAPKMALIPSRIHPPSKTRNWRGLFEGWLGLAKPPVKLAPKAIFNPQKLLDPVKTKLFV